MDIAELVLPVFAVIVTGWLAGALGYVPRTLAAQLVQFTYYVAMPALVFATIAREPIATLLDGGFLVAFGGGSAICFVAVLVLAGLFARRGLGSSAMLAAMATMTNTGFVALPILEALYGERGVVAAAIATVFVGVVMFPALVILLEIDRRDGAQRTGIVLLMRQVAINPVMLSTGLGLLWSLAGLPVPAPVAAYLGIFSHALTPCALFAVGLGLSFAGVRMNVTASAWLAVFKLVIVPLSVYGLSVAAGLDPFYTVAAVICAAVPTAKIAYVLAGTYQVEETMAATTISVTTLFSVATLLAWLYALG